MLNQQIFDVLKVYAFELLMIDLNHYDLSDIKNISNHLKSPFTNTKSKKYKVELKKLLENMNSDRIYHYVNQFDVNFLLFKYRKYNRVVILGPFLHQRPNEKRCHEMLQQVQIKYSKLSILKQYLLQIPVCPYSQALKMAHLTVRYLKNRNVHYKVETLDFSFHRNTESHAQDKEQYEYTFNKIKMCYDNENKMLTAIQNGNVDEALNLFSVMNVSVAGIRRVKDDLLNHKYKAYLLNTLCRKSIEKADVNLLIINEISANYAAEIDDATDVETLEIITKRMIFDYAQTALKVKSLNYSSNINTVIQHIKINLDHPIHLEELAELVGLAPSYLSRLFKQETGKSLSQYIMQLRVEKGRDLLLNTPMTVEEISSYVGFKQQSYFSKCFKIQYQQSPLEYKKSYSNEKVT